MNPSTIRHPLTAESPPSGEHFEFHSSARGPEGLFRFTWTLAAGKQGPAEHIHPKESHFARVRSGHITIWLDDVRHDLGPGDELTVPPGVAHRFMNFGSEPAVLDCANDGPTFEDFAIPIAVEGQRRGGKMTLGLMALIIVQAAATDPNIPTPRTRGIYRVMRALEWLLRRLGVRPLPPVFDWEPPASADDRRLDLVADQL